MGDSKFGAGNLTCYPCGCVAGALIFATILAGVFADFGRLWHEGATIFLSDAGIRIFLGVCIALVSAAPYVLLAKAAGKVDLPGFFTTAATSLLAFQIWFMVKTLFFTRSSTASIGLLFMPFYLCVPAAVIWAAAVLARELRTRRGGA